MLYVNGVLQTFGTTNYPSQNFDTQVNNTVLHTIGGFASLGGFYLDGYLTEINFIDGQALTPSSFGETNPVTGVWQPKKYAGTYGTNGFYLNFSNPSAATAAAIGADYSGNGNNWTPNNISVTAGVTYDSMLDVPTQWADGGNGRGNYCVLNPLAKNSSTALSNGNLSIAGVAATSVWYPASTTIKIPTSGKWYCEMTVGAADASLYRNYFGIITDAFPISTTTGIGNSSNGWAYFADDGAVYNNSSAIATLTASVTNDVIGLAFDADNGELRFYKNGVAMGTSALSGFTSSYFFACSVYSAATATANFGQRPFAYTPPTGFKALNTLNLPAPTILKGNQYFDVNIWSGDNSSSRAITNSGSMQPDLVWVKRRNGSADHALFDSVRGFGGNKDLSSNTTGAEGALNTSLYGNVSAANSTGFQLAAGSVDSSYTNRTGDTYVGWQWRAGVSAVTNTAGSITSTVDAGATQGFSIVTYTGTGANATVGHGLGVAPSMVITKGRDSVGGATNWTVYHVSVGNTGALFLNLTNATNTSSTQWNNTSPTSTVFSIGTSGDKNTNTATYVAYCFAAVAGYSAFGSYTGNGSTDGTFVYTGFRPRFILFKKTSATDDWVIYDTARDEYNVASKNLYPNGSFAEDSNTTNRSADILSNGFKLRSSGTFLNGSGATFIFAAFAENPFKNALAR
jgi:hypothetical protein